MNQYKKTSDYRSPTCKAVQNQPGHSMLIVKKTVSFFMVLLGLLFISNLAGAITRPGMPHKNLLLPLESGTASADQTINYNDAPATLTCTSAFGGNHVYAYQWQKRNSGAGWDDIPGATTLSYSPGTLAETSAYQVTTTSGGVIVSSNVVTITVNPQFLAPTISLDLNVNNGGRVVFSATAAVGGTGGLSYQWQKSISGGPYFDITYANSLNYLETGLGATSSFRLVATDAAGATATSTPITITVYPSLVAGAITPLTQSINPGNTAGSLTAAAATGGNGTYTYQWQTSPDNLFWSNISGATALTYAPGSPSLTTYYHLVSTSAGFNTTSTSAKVTVLTALVAGTLTPVTQTVVAGNIGGVITSTKPTGGDDTYAYQWQVSTNNSTWVDISGATAITYIPGVTSNTTYYRLKASSNGASAFTTASTVLIGTCIALNTNTTESMNYVATDLFVNPINTTVTDAQIALMTSCDVRQTIQYIDALGRPIQTVQVKGSPLQNDFVQPLAYDQYGRESVKYLPYAYTGANDGSFKANALTTGTNSQPGFYTAPNTPIGVTPDATPKAGTLFEPSPLNRVVEQGAPGNAWQLTGSGVSGSGNTVKIAYGTNASTDVILWTVNSGGNGATGTSNYTAGQLYSTTTTDENGNNTIEYKDKEGHIVCKKAQSGSNIYIATYYVYNNYNNLAYVIPQIPTGTTYPASFIESDAVFTNFMYGYHYDSRSRLTEKKIPGKTAWERMVYNQLDQLVMTQDAVQAGTNTWTVTKYDAQGRVVVTGLFNAGSVLTSATLNANIGAASQWDIRDASNNTTTNATGYVITSYPTLNQVLSINYYDDYNFPGNPYSAVSGALTVPTGLLTASKIAVLNDNVLLWAVNYYDDKGRLTDTYAQHYLGGSTALNTANYDHITNTYDFTNALTTSTRQHYKNSSGTATLALTVKNTYVYDNMGRKKQTLSQLNNGDNIVLSQTEYNEVGQLFKKKLDAGVDDGLTASGVDLVRDSTWSLTTGQQRTDVASNSIILTPGFHAASGSTYAAIIKKPSLQVITYAYNERGWLTQAAAPLLTYQLQYNAGSNPMYNGNITQMVYNINKTTPATHQFDYTYDKLNRLSTSISTGVNLNESMSYDELGNITALTRGGAAAATLAYGYAISGNGTNQLQTITNSGAAYRSYEYDANGNATSNGSDTTINYNMLNLPQTLTHSGSTITTYYYDISGQKLRTTSAGDGTWDYVNGINYHNNSISSIATEEGLITVNSGVYVYNYNLKDHLGNVRVTIGKDASNGTATVLQEDEYYAFGLRKGLFDASTDNRYLYNGKEVQKDLNGQYDYGARFYDPVIGRWTSVDPLVENGQESTTPYGYVFDDPIKNTDPDGREPEEANGCCGIRNAIKSVLAVATAIPNAILSHRFKSAVVQGVDRANKEFGFPTLTETANVINGDTPTGEFLEKSLNAAIFVATEAGGENPNAKSLVPEPHGNSASSLKEQHGYEIYNKTTDKTLEYGISGQKIKIDKEGNERSPRIEQKLREKYKKDPNIGGRIKAKIKNRADALKWEKDQVTNFTDENGTSPINQIRPKP